MSIQRPDVHFDEKTHTYTLDGKRLLGVSSISKLGEDSFGPASWWGWKVGYEGALEVATNWRDQREDELTPELLRDVLKSLKKTPNHVRDSAAKRGTAIHDALETLAQTGVVPTLEQYPEHEQGYVKALCSWYVDYRPQFVATEVQVVSEEHGFAGRYDIRCRLYHEAHPSGELALVDLKTSKRVYTSHEVQLAGYELASVEMGFAPSDAQYVLRVDQDGSYEFARSHATVLDFLARVNLAKQIKAHKERAK